MSYFHHHGRRAVWRRWTQRRSGFVHPCAAGYRYSAISDRGGYAVWSTIAAGKGLSSQGAASHSHSKVTRGGD